MKKLKKLCTWFIWCITSPIWGAALKYYNIITVPEIEKVHGHLWNLLSGLGILGEELARNFDFEVNKRLHLLLYWASKHKGITLVLDLTKSATDIMNEINSYYKNKPFGITIKQDEEDFFVFKYKTHKSDRWIEQSFPDGTIWGKEMSTENKNLAYLVNIMLNWKEV